VRGGVGPQALSACHVERANSQLASAIYGAQSDLRHYFASVQIRGGQSIKVLQALLGHKSAVETWDAYGRLMGDEDTRSRALIGAELMGGKQADKSSQAGRRPMVEYISAGLTSGVDGTSAGRRDTLSAGSTSYTEVTMTSSNPQPDLPAEWVSDKVDLDDLFKDAKPYGNGEDWAIPGFFESDEEQQEFVRWYRAERQKSLA